MAAHEHRISCHCGGSRASEFWAQEALEEAVFSLGFCTSARALAALLGNAIALVRFRRVARREEDGMDEFS